MAKITAWFTSIVLVVVGALVAFIPFGNPLSKYLVTKNAETYIEENFQNSDYEIETVNYDFKTGSYYVEVISPSSGDSSFTIYAGTDGKIGYNTYEDAVLEKWNTANRINDEYWYAVKDIVESERFPYYQNIAFGNIEFTDSDTPVGSDIPEYAIATSSLELDAEYDIYEMGKKAGHLTIYIYDNEVTIERLSEILLGIRQLFDKENISFYIIDCVLEYPRPEDDEPWKEGRVEVMNFLYEDIYEDSLKERVNESNEKAKAYYKAMDALK
jgi:hypothetical protein